VACRNCSTESLTQHFPGWAISRLPAYICLPHRAGNSMGRPWMTEFCLNSGSNQGPLVQGPVYYPLVYLPLDCRLISYKVSVMRYKNKPRWVARNITLEKLPDKPYKSSFSLIKRILIRLFQPTQKPLNGNGKIYFCWLWTSTEDALWRCTTVAIIAIIFTGFISGEVFLWS